ncbi:hypothetical protein [Zooshikella sp. RANM57]|uniref:hypothetical protein n=1 Tax=Zooshikella sp. RANM57 TaxID=3425863 RepID=UPI003D6EC83F
MKKSFKVHLQRHVGVQWFLLSWHWIKLRRRQRMQVIQKSAADQHLSSQSFASSHWYPLWEYQRHHWHR